MIGDVQLDREVLAGCKKLLAKGIHPSYVKLRDEAGVRRCSRRVAASRHRLVAAGKLKLVIRASGATEGEIAARIDAERIHRRAKT